MASVGVRAGSATVFKVEARIGARPAMVGVIVQAGDAGTRGGRPAVRAVVRRAAADQQHAGALLRRQDLRGRRPGQPARAVPRTPSPLAVGETQRQHPGGQHGPSTSAIFVEALGPGPTDPGRRLRGRAGYDRAGRRHGRGRRCRWSTPSRTPSASFAVTSTLTFAPPLAAAAVLAARWADLSDCPLDPAQLWLDCTVDALSTSASDPLDCVPAAAAGGEGQLGDAIAARRGAWLTDGTGAAIACRGARDAGGQRQPGRAGAGAVRQPDAAGRGRAAGDRRATRRRSWAASGWRRRWRWRRRRSPGPTRSPTRCKPRCSGPGWTVSVLLAPLGLPVLQAVTSATIDERRAEHRAARLHAAPRVGGARGVRAAGAGAARVSRGRGRLRRRPVRAGASAGGASGCDALDATVCPASADRPAVWLAACRAGLDALAARLDAGFAAADGPDLDLTLAGTAPLVAVPGGLRAHYLGVGEIQSSRGAVWTATVRTSVGSSTLFADFQGVRN